MKSELTSRIEAESKARRDAQRDTFLRYLSEWHVLRGQSEDPAGDDETDEVATARADRVDELARLITTTPAALPYLVFDKIEVLENALGGCDGTAWSDNREIVMLAGIKADLLRFKLAEGEA